MGSVGSASGTYEGEVNPDHPDATTWTTPEYNDEHYTSKSKDNLEETNGTIKTLTIQLSAAETPKDTQGSPQHPHQSGRDHDLEYDAFEGTETNEECSGIMCQHKGKNPPSYKEIERWVESESMRRRAISLRDEAHYLQSDKVTGTIPIAIIFHHMTCVLILVPTRTDLNQ